MKHLTLDPSHPQAPTRDLAPSKEVPDSLPAAKETKTHPGKKGAGGENARLLFVGTATVVLYVGLWFFVCLFLFVGGGLGFVVGISGRVLG